MGTYIGQCGILELECNGQLNIQLRYRVKEHSSVSRISGRMDAVSLLSSSSADGGITTNGIRCSPVSSLLQWPDQKTETHSFHHTLDSLVLPWNSLDPAESLG